MTTDRTMRQERNAAIAIAAVTAANPKREEPEPEPAQPVAVDDSEWHG